MAQNPRGPQRCFLVTPDNGVDNDPIVRRQVRATPGNIRSQVVRIQAPHASPKPIPVRTAIVKPVAGERPRLKHAVVAPVPVEDVHRRRTAELFDEVWPAWRIPAGIRSPYSAQLTKLWGAMLQGEVVNNAGVVDLVLPISAWRTQIPDMLACFRTCLLMINKTNAQVPSDFRSSISMLREKDKN